MTDTTAPDAITQALHVRFSDDGQHIRKWDRKSFDGSSEYRLAAHGAGEGLRRAFNTAWSEACCHLAPGTGLHTAERDEAWADFARSTPPTDAGSTTREGGEGVRAVAIVEARFPGWQATPAMRGFAKACVSAALATTSSPDASPDSGEAPQQHAWSGDDTRGSPDGYEGPICLKCGVADSDGEAQERKA